MAAKKTMTDVKLQVVVENGTTGTGRKATKNLSFSQIKITAIDDQLMDAGKAIAGLLSSSLSGIRLINTYDLTEAG